MLQNMKMIGLYFHRQSDISRNFEVIKEGLKSICPEIIDEDFVSLDRIHLTLCMFHTDDDKMKIKLHQCVERVLKKHLKKFPLTLSVNRLEQIGPKIVCSIRRDKEFNKLFKLHHDIEGEILKKCEGTQYISNFVHGRYYVTLLHGKRRREYDFNEKIVSMINENCQLSSIRVKLEDILIYEP